MRRWTITSADRLGRADVRVLPLAPEHEDAVEGLLQTGLREEEAFAARCDPPEDQYFFEAELREHLSGLRQAPHQWRIAADREGRVQGLLWLLHEEDRLGPYASVRQIIVDPRCRRRGIGTRLLRHAEAEARSDNAVMMLISAFRTNPAWRLYRALGFEDLPAEYRLDRNPEHVVLWKCLDADALPTDF